MARPQHTQQRPQYTDLAAVGSTSSEAHSQSHNPSGLARTALYKLQLPCLVTLNLPNSHGFLSQRNYKEAGNWNSKPELHHPCFLFPCSGYPKQMGEGYAWGYLKPSRPCPPSCLHAFPLYKTMLKPFSGHTMYWRHLSPRGGLLIKGSSSTFPAWRLR